VTNSRLGQELSIARGSREKYFLNRVKGQVVQKAMTTVD
jgi:hypothetical protein